MLALLLSPAWATPTHDLSIVDVRGIAVRDGELLAVDPRKASLRRWRIEGDAWRSVEAVALPAGLDAPRGLGLTDGAAWVIDWREEDRTSELWRIERGTGRADAISLASVVGDAEPFDLAWHGTDLYLVTSGGPLRLAVGDHTLASASEAPIARLPQTGPPTQEGFSPTQSITIGEVDGHPYLFTTARGSVIVSDLRTGRSLFAIEGSRADFPIWGLAASGDTLWITDRLERKRDTVHTRSLSTLDQTDPGPWRVRTAHLSTHSVPKDSAPRASGWVTHAYGHPFALPGQRPLMDRWQASARGASETQPTWRVGDDPETIQTDTIFRWEAGKKTRVSEVELWVRSRDVRQGIYPHRVTGQPPAAPGYVSDSALHRLDHQKRWRRFHDRVVRYVSDRYDLSPEEARAELSHPYWASRDVVDYIFSAYLYPNNDLDIDVTVDRERGIFHGYPADEKAALSAPPFEGDEILACNGGNLVLEGALRSLGLGTRLMGSIFSRSKGDWDLDGDGFLDPGERKPGAKRHQYAQVWLGEPYGWQIFDATPETFVDADRTPPPAPAQWDVMRESVATSAGRRVVMSLFSGLHEPMVRNFPSDIDGFEQAYAFFGRYGDPRHWRYPDHRVQFSNPLGIGAEARATGDTLRVSWSLIGPWEILADPQLEILLEPWRAGERIGPARTVGDRYPIAPAEAILDLPPPPEDARWRVVVRLWGDSATGTRTDPLDPDR